MAIAGGYAIQTVEMGGKVNVLYVTNGCPDDNCTRKKEAFDAWSTIGVGQSALHFLRYPVLTGLTERTEIDTCITEIGEFIKGCNPDLIFVPLYEGGNYQHDVTNYIVSEALREYKLNISVYEAPEYNFRFSLKVTPEKILSGFTKLIPFVKYNYPPEPVRDDKVYYLNMSTHQLELKRTMLSKFKTQNPDKLVERFGFEDRYQRLHNYDYSRPPFNYKFSLARKINFLKALPVVGKFVSQAVKWTKTIHPDPDYTMTIIPLSIDSKNHKTS
mgnify:CR=1 FL=1